MSIISEQGALQLFPSTLECLFSLSCLVERRRYLPSTKVIHRHPVSRNLNKKTKTKKNKQSNKKTRLIVDPSEIGHFRNSVKR